MSDVTQYPPTVFIYGPQTVSKAFNAARLRAHFGCAHTLVDFDTEHGEAQEGALHLCLKAPSMNTFNALGNGVIRVYAYDDAMGRLQAAQEPEPRTRTSKGLGTNRTDFKGWKRETLELFARQAADENLVLRERLFELETEKR